MARIHALRIRIMGPDVDTYTGSNLIEMSNNFDKKNQEVVNDIRSSIPQIEDIVNDQLPDGFYCKVEE